MSRYTRVAALGVATAAAAAIATSGVAAAAGPQSAALASSGGKSTLTLDSAQRRAGVRVGGGALSITGGTANPSTLAGTVRHSGSITVRRGRKSATLRSVVVTLGATGSLTARTRGKNVRIATLSGGSVARDGLDATKSGISVKLARAGASALNRALGVRAFRAGARLGRLTVAAKFGQAVVSSGTTTVNVDPSAAGSLLAQGARFAPIAPATLDPSTLALKLPVSGGLIGIRSQPTQVLHDGGVLLSKGATQVPLTGFGIELGVKRPALTVAKPQAMVFAELSGATAPTVNAGAKTATITGLVLRLSAEGSAALAQLQVTMAPGTLLGIGSFTTTLK